MSQEETETKPKKTTTKAKCPICGQQGVKTEMIYDESKKKYYHQGICYKQRQLEIKEAQSYKDLVQYLCNLTEVTSPNPVWMSTIKKYREDSNYTCTGIMLTVKLYYEFMGKPIKNETNMLGIVPYYYEEAKKKYIEGIERKKNTRVFFSSGQELVQHEKVVVRYEEPTNTFRQGKLIDMSQFEEDEE